MARLAQVVAVGAGTAESIVCERCLVADNPWLRLRGLLGRSSLASGEGLLLRRSGSIHMFFMRFAIDAVFLDRDDEVISVCESVRPWRVAARRGARAVLELSEGEVRARGIEPGMRLLVSDGDLDAPTG